jgi:hypothetical protein
MAARKDYKGIFATDNTDNNGSITRFLICGQGI